MSRSIVGNPAWYRDDEGRTGFKPREWENLPNEQKEQVKKRKEKKEEDDTQVKEIDEELLRSRERELKAAKPPLERKLSKEEKKELKKKEKEDKKREKEEKKKEKEERKKVEKEEKERRKSQTSLEKVEEKEDKKRQKEEEGIQEGTMELEQKKDKKKRKESAYEEINYEKKERRRSRSRDKSPAQKEKEKAQPAPRKESDASMASSSKSTDTVKHHPGKPPHYPSLDSKSTLPSSPSSSNDDERRNLPPRQPRKTTIGERRDSSMSESSRVSGVSHKSVTFSDRVQTHEIERIHLSSSEDDVAVMSDDELSKPDSERRRKLVRMLQDQEEQTDSEDDFEEQERLIEQKMLEEEMLHRHQAMYPVYNLEETVSLDSLYPEDHDPDRYLLEEDGSYISLDKLPAAVRRAIIADMRGREEEPTMGSMTKLHEDGPYPQGYILPRSASGYLDENYMVASYQQAMYGAFNHEHGEGDPSPSQLHPHSHPGSAFSPPFQRRLEAGPPQTLLPSKFTDVPSLSSQNSSLQLQPTIPQIVSPDDETSPTEYNRVPRTLGERRQLNQLHESFYDNVPSRSNSLVGPPPGTSRLLQGRIGSESRLPVISPVKSLEETPIPSPPRRGSSTSIERRAFFESMNPSLGGVHAREPEQTPTPSPPRLTPAPPGVHKVLVTTSTTSTVLTNRTEVVEKQQRSEDEMRQKFVRQFGPRKAPKAEEEDPLDPGPTYGSKESVYSTDSRESVVSEASIRKENLTRRNFNY